MSVLILHESDGRPYFEAIEKYCSSRGIKITYRETSVIRLAVKDLLLKRLTKSRLGMHVENLLFRIYGQFQVFDIVVYGAAPYDYRTVLYAPVLFRARRVIYHTSWPDWRLDSVPRRYFVVTSVLRYMFSNILNSTKQFNVVGVIPEAVSAVRKAHPEFPEPHLIPHTVSFTKPIDGKAKTGEFAIGFLGKLIPEKGVIEFLELAKMNQNLGTFRIGGDGKLRPLVQQAHDSEIVTYLGTLAKQQVFDYLSSLDILMVPSQRHKKWEELFGMVIIEAMAMGVIVIASSHVGPRGIITNNHDGFLVDESEIYSSVDIIREMKRDRERANVICSNAQSTACKYSLVNVTCKWLSVLQ